MGNGCIPTSWDGPGQKSCAETRPGFPQAHEIIFLPVMISSASKHNPNQLGTRGTENEGVPTLLVSMVSNQENVQESPAMVKQPGFPKGH
ncbi:hypothetical protein I79_021103 [Cricetulus griseus]|uniref:Uncharacterized protein n=1 Tax=Cricetulus griseus TaxID=10029 RepID=G3IBS1_CRIGR|nr:hypothetical protein I79_021103 [Cricetulus griseus]